MPNASTRKCLDRGFRKRSCVCGTELEGSGPGAFRPDCWTPFANDRKNDDRHCDFCRIHRVLMGAGRIVEYLLMDHWNSGSGLANFAFL